MTDFELKMYGSVPVTKEGALGRRVLALLKHWQWLHDSDLCGYCGAFRVVLESCSNAGCEAAALIRELEGHPTTPAGSRKT